MNHWSISLAGISFDWRVEAQKRGKYYFQGAERISGLLELIEGSELIAGGMRELWFDGLGLMQGGIVELLEKVPGLRSLSLQSVRGGLSDDLWIPSLVALSRMRMLKTFHFVWCSIIPSNAIVV